MTPVSWKAFSILLSPSLSFKLRSEKENHTHVLRKGQVLLSATAQYLNIDFSPNGCFLSDYLMNKNDNNFSLSVVTEF